MVISSLDDSIDIFSVSEPRTPKIAFVKPEFDIPHMELDSHDGDRILDSNAEALFSPLAGKH